MMTFLDIQEAVARLDQTTWQHSPGPESLKALQTLIIENIGDSLMTPKRANNLPDDDSMPSWQTRWCAEAPGVLIEHAARIANYSERSLETCLLQSLEGHERRYRSIHNWLITVISHYDQEFSTIDYERALTKNVVILVSEQLPLYDAVQRLDRGEKLENGNMRRIIQTACEIMRHAGIALMHRSNLDGPPFKLLTISELENSFSATFEEHLIKLKNKKPPR